jgi:phage terminase large subunit-like protein
MRARPGPPPPIARSLRRPAPPWRTWRTWLFQGGRGAGKTRAGAEWLAAQIEQTPSGRFALVGATLHDVREVMIEGPSGLRWLHNRAPPRYAPTRRRLLFANGAVADAFSAAEPQRLRGPQFHAA